ncbi:MAG: helix-turn-helix domain-containing protein [Candidatus Anammoximicrobium sp.]|nr:helix-turn-helix domain-containing protein [Candidatus Anammoximicrobium sp.]
MSHRQKNFGEVLREMRLAKGFSLRKFAKLVDVSPTYLSQVEQENVDPPTAERVQRMAEILGENADELIALAGRVPDDLPEIIQRRPTAIPELLREANGLSADQLRALTEYVRKLKQEGT